MNKTRFDHSNKGGGFNSLSSGSGGSPTGPASGDLSGMYPNPTVYKIKGNTIPINADGYLKNDGTGVLTWATPSTSPTGAAGGDLSGTYPNPGVAKILGNTVPANANGYLKNDGTGVLTWATPSTAPTGSAGGDLSGTYPNPGVAKILGNAVPANSAGVLTNDGAGVLSWSASGLAPAYAQIYGDDVAATQAFTVSTWTKVTGFETNGLSSNCTADKTNNKITVTRAGTYRISIRASTSISFSGVDMRAQAYVDGVAVASTIGESNQIDDGVYLSCYSQGLVSIAANKDVDLRLKFEGGSSSFTVTKRLLSLLVEYVGS